MNGFGLSSRARMVFGCRVYGFRVVVFQGFGFRVAGLLGLRVLGFQGFGV